METEKFYVLYFTAFGPSSLKFSLKLLDVQKRNVFWLRIKLIQNSVIFRTFLLRSYSGYCQTSMIGFFLQNYLKDIDVWQGPKWASGLLYDLDVCHRDGFNTCSPRVIRPQLTNNMVLFSANGTNSSVLRTGLNTYTAITLSEPVPMLSTRSSKFYVSTIFLQHCKIYYSFKKMSHECEQIFPYLLEEKESFIICSANRCF